MTTLRFQYLDRDGRPHEKQETDDSLPIPRVGERVTLNEKAGENVSVPTDFRVTAVRHDYTLRGPWRPYVEVKLERTDLSYPL